MHLKLRSRRKSGCIKSFIFTLDQIFKLHVFQITTVKFGPADVWMVGRLLGNAEKEASREEK